MESVIVGASPSPRACSKNWYAVFPVVFSWMKPCAVGVLGLVCSMVSDGTRDAAWPTNQVACQALNTYVDIMVLFGHEDTDQVSLNHRFPLRARRMHKQRETGRVLPTNKPLETN